jgi:hypothetical protein
MHFHQVSWPKNIYFGGANKYHLNLYFLANVLSPRPISAACPMWTMPQPSVGECAKNVKGKGRQNKSPCCVLWADENRLFLIKRQDRGLLCIRQTCHSKIAKSKTTWQTTWTKDTKDTRTTPRGQKLCSRGQKICEELG